MNHIVFFSSGAASTVAALRVAQKFGTKSLYLVFSDTLIEDEDNYRFLVEAHHKIGGELIWLKDGRTPWDIFESTKWLSHRGIKCSHLLKIAPAQQWLREQDFSPEETTLYFGINFEELHRLEAISKNWTPFPVDIPLCWDEFGWADRTVIFNELYRAGLNPPRLYEMGFAHANCGGFCPKAGQAHYRLLLQQLPERYSFHEQKEQDFLRHHKNQSVGILRKTAIVNGEKRTVGMTLKEWRLSIESELSVQPSLFDEFVGGCGCFIDS
ncbi:hypothetical protein Lepto7376_3702 [[Leptolyngbya] sp. PCC 7376]|uniref:phosphoadenosine phosphosulfate reductase domain-containing protein n=1 Tax=[Leptolyngbya] sp. PCC 7376 TaxID=111781 RepID=UPI00029ED60C|nr:phosphoadenosine phosphosulfate reductase family protein [[Leptolyngbya] sp. PCC 7376]AFY39878.1 hypothetical protein Lepto7376_3702 [[Leptolyngbya] sp. PCC 7376]